MSRVQFRDPWGKATSVDVEEGTSLMRAALEAGIEGIVAECGGSAACGTCHIYVDEEWVDRLPKPDAVEDGLLDFTVMPRQRGSRLSCQVLMKDAFAGIGVTVSERQT